MQESVSSTCAAHPATHPPTFCWLPLTTGRSLFAYRVIPAAELMRLCLGKLYSWCVHTASSLTTTSTRTQHPPVFPLGAHQPLMSPPRAPLQPLSKKEPAHPSRKRAVHSLQHPDWVEGAWPEPHEARKGRAWQAGRACRCQRRHHQPWGKYWGPADLVGRQVGRRAAQAGEQALC